jgi:translation initiation factor IF-3
MQNNQKKFVRINRQITCSSVRVKKDGEHLGIMPTSQALDLAYRNELDLVEIVSNTNPPIVEIMDYNKFKFEEKKRKKEQQSKAKTIAPKAVRLRPVSGDHDVDTKIEQIKNFLDDKHPVEVNILFKNNREMVFKEHGFEIANRIVAAVEEHGVPQDKPKFEGNRISIRLVPKSK